MAQFRIYAMPCKFERENGYTSVSYMMFADKLASEVVECRACSDIDAALAAMRDEVIQTHAGSFFVSALLMRGERAPSGFRKRTFKVEVDRDTQSAAVAS